MKKLFVILSILTVLNLVVVPRAHATTYATWNSGDKTAGATLGSGNLQITNAGGSWQGARSDISKSSGKWYWEITVTTGGADMFPGISKAAVGIGTPYVVSAGAGDGYGYGSGNGNKRASPSTDTAYGASYTSGDKIMIALDMDNGKIWWGKNGTWQGSGDPAAGTNAAFTGVSGTYFATESQFEAINILANFGATAFTYTVPTGFCAGLVDVCPSGAATVTPAAPLTWQFWMF